MTPAYTNQSKNHSSFQEEDFPALVSKIKPLNPQSNTRSAWSQAGSKPVVVSNKPVVLPTRTAPTVSSSILSASDPPPSGSVPQPLTAASSRRKKKLTSAETHKTPPKVKYLSSSDDEDLQTGKTAQEIRTVPTMLDISTLLTVKGGSSQPNPKTNKKKKQATTSSLDSPSHTPESVSKMAHKENVPETKPPDKSLASKTNSFINRLLEKPAEALSPTSFPENIPSPLKQPVTDQPPPPKEEEFPALISRKPPPGKPVPFLKEAVPKMTLFLSAYLCFQALKVHFRWRALRVCCRRLLLALDLLSANLLQDSPASRSTVMCWNHQCRLVTG